MDATDRAIDGEPSKIERVFSIGVWVVLAVLVLYGVAIFVGYMLGFTPNLWYWVAALLVAFVVYVLAKLLLDGKLKNSRKRTQPDQGDWSPS